MSDLYFIITQFIGIIAWFILLISYYRKTENKIIIFQVIATLLYCLHYYMLGAYSGLFVCVFEVIRDYLYYKTDKDKLIFMCSIPMYFVFGIISYTAIIDILPLISSIIDGFSLINKKKIILICAVVSYTLWVIYDIAVMSYSCALTDGLIAVSNLCLLLFNKKLVFSELKKSMFGDSK